MLTPPGEQSLWAMVWSGGPVMIPLLLCSLISWAVILERFWNFRRLGNDLRAFHLEALNILLRGDRQALRGLCDRDSHLPTAKILHTAIDRLSSNDARIRAKWREAMERRRQLLNQELKSYLWVLGTIGSSAPFIGLFGTVVGVLQSFQQMAQKGTGGFAVVAAGISEALIATAVGIVVAVIAVMAFNAFLTRWNQLVLTIRMQTEEFIEIISATEPAENIKNA